MKPCEERDPDWKSRKKAISKRKKTIPNISRTATGKSQPKPLTSKELTEINHELKTIRPQTKTPKSVLRESIEAEELKQIISEAEELKQIISEVLAMPVLPSLGEKEEFEKFYGKVEIPTISNTSDISDILNKLALPKIMPSVSSVINQGISDIIMTSDSHSDSYKEMLVPPRSSTATPTSAYRGHNVNSVFSGFIPHCEPVLDAGQLLPALYQEKKS